MTDSKVKLPPLSEKDRATLLDLVEANDKYLFSIDKKCDAVKKKNDAWDNVSIYYMFENQLNRYNISIIDNVRAEFSIKCQTFVATGQEMLAKYCLEGSGTNFCSSESCEVNNLFLPLIIFLGNKHKIQGVLVVAHRRRH